MHDIFGNNDGKRLACWTFYKIIGDDIEDRGGVWGGECGREPARVAPNSDFSNLLLVEARLPFSEIKVAQKCPKSAPKGGQPAGSPKAMTINGNQWKTN